LEAAECLVPGPRAYFIAREIADGEDHIRVAQGGFEASLKVQAFEFGDSPRVRPPVEILHPSATQVARRRGGLRTNEENPFGRNNQWFLSFFALS